MTYIKPSNGTVRYLGSRASNTLPSNPVIGDIVKLSDNAELLGEVSGEIETVIAGTLIMFDGGDWIKYLPGKPSSARVIEIGSSMTLPAFVGQAHVDSTAAAVTIELPEITSESMPDITIIAQKLVHPITVTPSTSVGQDANSKRINGSNTPYVFGTENDAITLTLAAEGGWRII